MSHYHSYTSYCRVCEFLMNRDRRSSYLPKFGVRQSGAPSAILAWVKVSSQQFNWHLWEREVEGLILAPNSVCALLCTFYNTSFKIQFDWYNLMFEILIIIVFCFYRLVVLVMIPTWESLLKKLKSCRRKLAPSARKIFSSRSVIEQRD